MLQMTVSDEIKSLVPSFKVGIITYHDIVISDSPQMLKGRLEFYQELLQLEAETNPLNQVPEINEWRSTFKKLGTDPSRYRPSSEALLRRIYNGKKLGFIHSAADTNNFFSLQYKIPLGIYDLDALKGPIPLKIGTSNDSYRGLNARNMNMESKLITADQMGAFGSPIVDSNRTMVTEKTTNALQIVYLTPSIEIEQAQMLLAAIEKMFTQINGGTSASLIVR
jgi:DNA/RNA-binding domain of Phe-tRNA-synthetase-like protein